MGGNDQDKVVFYCDLVSLISSCQCEQTVGMEATSLWNQFDAYDSFLVPISFGQQLITMHETQRSATIDAFSPPTQSWICVEDLPVEMSCGAAILLPNGVLFVIGKYHDYDDGVSRSKAFKASLTSKLITNRQIINWESAASLTPTVS